MPLRPFAGLSIVALEEKVAEHRSDIELLQTIHNELCSRRTARASRLRAEVESLLAGSAPSREARVADVEPPIGRTRDVDGPIALLAAEALAQRTATIRAERIPDSTVARELSRRCAQFDAASLGLEGALVEQMLRASPVMLPVKRWGGSLGWPSYKRRTTWERLLAQRGIADAPLNRGLLVRCQILGADWVPHPDVPEAWAMKDRAAFENYVVTSENAAVVNEAYALALDWRAENAEVLHRRLAPRITGDGVMFAANYHAYGGLQYVDIALVIPEGQDEALRVRSVWRGESALAELVRQLFPDAIREHSADWLGSQRLDVYVPSRNLAFEYHGEQHYQVVAHFGGEEALERNRERDQRKRQACAAAGVTLVEWPHWRTVTMDVLRSVLQGHGVSTDVADQEAV